MYLTGLIIVALLIVGFALYNSDKTHPINDLTYGSMLFCLALLIGSWISVIIVGVLMLTNYSDWIEDQLPEHVWEFLKSKPFNND